MSQAHAFRSVAALALVAVVGLGQAALASSAITLKRIHDPRHVTYSIHIASCHARDHGKLPDRSCTPGSIDPAVTQRNIRSTICRAGWTAKVRPPESQTEWAKYHVAYPAYHIPGSAVSELDHLVPLELGGSNDITNLWPEVGKIPNPKDKVEDALNHAVCDGRVRLAAAQNAIAADWLTAEARLGIGGSGGGGGGAWCTASASNANDGYPEDENVYVHSNQPATEATASSPGDTWSDETNGAGSVTILLYYTPAGSPISVKVGAASCSTTAT